MTGIVESLLRILQDQFVTIGLDILLIVALAVEAVLVIFFMVKSSLSYESSLNKALDKLNTWLFMNKVVTENSIQEFNALVKNVAPKRLCYYWQQYILFREGTPSSYMSAENLIERPLKTSSYASNIKNLNIFSIVWSVLMAFMFLLAGVNNVSSGLTAQAALGCLFVMSVVLLLNLIFTVSLRARKNAVTNSIYQSLQTFDRFMDNACFDLPTYIDYQILFTPQEIEKGQPVLREFLDYKTRREKEEFQKAQEEDINSEVYDFSAARVNGSTILERAMKESEKYLNKKDKLLVQISQLENELETRKKNFDSIQKDFQTKLQASKENIDSLLQQQQETTNRIESNYLRKQQKQEIDKQEQLEQEFEQQRAKYILEKNELEDEVKALNANIEQSKKEVENIMLGEYQNFFNSLCKSTEKVVKRVFAERIDNLKERNKAQQEQITELEIKLKNMPQGGYAEEIQNTQATETTENTSATEDGHYDENGNYVYSNGSYYDANGLFHDVDGKVYNQDGTVVENAEKQETEVNETKEEVSKQDQPSEAAQEEIKEQVEENNETSGADNEQVEEQSEDDIDGSYDENGNYVYSNGSYYDPEGMFHDVDGKIYDQDGNFVSNGKPLNSNEPEEVKVVEDENVTLDKLEPEGEKTSIDLDSLDAFDFMTDVDMKDDIYDMVKNIVNGEDSSVEAYSSPKKNKKAEETLEESETDEKVEEQAEEKNANLEENKDETSNEPIEEDDEDEEETDEGEEVVEEAPKKGRGRPKKGEESGEKRGPGRPKNSGSRKKIVGKKKTAVKDEVDENAPKRSRGRPRKTTDNNSLDEINKKIEETENRLSATRDNLNKELEDVISNMNSANASIDEDRKNEIFKEIEQLQEEAKRVNQSGSQEEIAEINRKIEELISEVKKYNS